MTYPNGLQSQFTYDDLNRLTKMNGYSYTLGPTGNRTGASEPSGRTLGWQYDGIYRLTQETISGAAGQQNGTATYNLDPVGNRNSLTSTIPGLPSASYTYDADDRMLATETYDNNGNTLVTGARTFTYDFENRLKTMTNSQTGATATIVYDGDGNRVAKTANGVTTQYVVDDLNPTGYPQVVEELVSGATTRTYTYGLQRTSENQLISNIWTPSFYGYDGFGSVRTLTDVTGTVTDTYDYDAWGNAVNTTGSTPNNYLYRGEQYDPDLRLYYLRARYLNPLSGRFLTRDPEAGCRWSPIMLHKYLYANGDPVGFSDPTGRVGEAVAKPGSATEYTFLLLLTLMAIQSIQSASRSNVATWKEADLELTCDADLVRCLEKYSQPPYKTTGPKGGKRRPPPSRIDCGACYRQCKHNLADMPTGDPWPYDKCPL